LNLDSFLISILFDEANAKNSADKINGIVQNLTQSIVKAFTTIASIDFLKNAVESSMELSTKLDNLSYVTNISKDNLNAWGEAVKRNGGTAEQFYTSISNLSSKIRELQTNFGAPGQLAFARLGINLKDSTGHIKTAVQVLGELGDKFKNLPKTWQLKLGEQLGLDPATIRLLASGNKEALDLVQHMKELGDIKDSNIESTLKFRNAMYDLQLVWQSTTNTISTMLLPVLKVFTHYLEKSLLFLKNNPYLIQSGLIAIATVVTTILAPAFLRLMVSMAPLLGIGAVIAGIALVIQDLIVWLHGGTSAFGEYYQKIADVTAGMRKFISEHKEGLTTLAKVLGGLVIAFQAVRIAMLAVSMTPIGLAITLISTALVGLITHWDDVTKAIDKFADKASNVYGKVKDTFSGGVDSAKSGIAKTYDATKSAIAGTISGIADALGFDKEKALTIANIESNLNPNARPRDKNGNPIGTASGLYQLIDSTAKESGIKDLKNKNDPTVNAKAGILNLKSTEDKLSHFLKRAITGGELYLGEMFGVEGSKKLLAANKNTPISLLLSSTAIKNNHLKANQTSGSLISRANKMYQNNSVSMGDVNIHSPKVNSSDISHHVKGHMQKALNSLVTNTDNGVIQ
jgi:hypothetical protein